MRSSRFQLCIDDIWPVVLYLPGVVDPRNVAVNVPWIGGEAAWTRDTATLALVGVYKNTTLNVVFIIYNPCDFWAISLILKIESMLAVYKNQYKYQCYNDAHIYAYNTRRITIKIYDLNVNIISFRFFSNSFSTTSLLQGFKGT